MTNQNTQLQLGITGDSHTLVDDIQPLSDGRKRGGRRTVPANLTAAAGRLGQKGMAYFFCFTRWYCLGCSISR